MRPKILYPYFTNIQYLKGIGPILSQKIAKLVGGETYFDLACHRPHSIIDRTKAPKIYDAKHGEICTFRLQIDKHDIPKRKGAPAKIYCSNSSGVITLLFFNYNAEALKTQFPVGQQRIVSGRVEIYNDIAQIVHPDRVAKIENAKDILRVEPQYPLTAGVTELKINRAIAQVMHHLRDLPEWEPTSKISFLAAISKLHNPTNLDDLSPSSKHIRRLAFDELLASQMAYRFVHKAVTQHTQIIVNQESVKVSQVASNLPFKLTNDQNKALAEIMQDMSSGQRMFRLVQGDVGSGKTAVAMLSAVSVVEIGAQTCIMAPTTLLANQHYNWISKTSGLKVALLTGNEKGNKRKEILEATKNGEIDILVGTHALIQDWVEFQNLGLIVIDEQHRFGVMQRLALSQKNPEAHILLMTATPIPRSLTIAQYGDMDISKIVEKPADRIPIETFVMSISKMPEIIESIKRALHEDEKIYWICPLVAESEKSDLAAAEERFKFFQKILGNQVGLIHGKMKEAEKAEILQKFKNNELKMLVATTVVEVGIDVQDATIMFIEHSERFGLSQLHQLRGRVGRGNKKSRCILLYAGNLGEVSAERLKVMKKYDDGFKIAEEDLRIRGGGDILGTKQSGFIGFKFATLPEHEDLLNDARDKAKEIVKMPTLSEPNKVLLCLFGYDESLNYINAG